MIETILTSPLLGLTLSCLAWCVGLWVQKKTKLILCNPLIIAVILVVIVLNVFHIPFQDFNLGGEFITLMLGPVTALLALNIYQQRALLGRYFLPVVVGCLAGSLASVGSVLLLCRLLPLEEAITASLMPKSVTTAIAVAIAGSGGGVESLAIAAVMVAGITGALFAPMFARLFHITDPVAQGVAIGACSHALGTTRAMEIGQLQGAMSSIAICICGLITSVIALLTAAFR